MAETKPGFNVWQVATAVATSLSIALITGLFGLLKTASDNAKDIAEFKTEIAELRQDNKELKAEFFKFQLTTNAKFSTVDNIKEGVDRLNRLNDNR